jgi:hypothetical protein
LITIEDHDGLSFFKQDLFVHSYFFISIVF